MGSDFEISNLSCQYSGAVSSLNDFEEPKDSEILFDFEFEEEEIAEDLPVVLPSSDEVESLRVEFEKVKDEQGFLGNIWNGIKNITCLGLGSNKVENTINDFENGKITYEQAYSTLQSFREKQKSGVDIITNTVSGVLTGFATVFTGGIGIAAIGLGSLSGGIIKSGFKFLDRATNDVVGDALDGKQLAKDFITGAADGAASVATGGMNGRISSTFAGSFVSGVKQGVGSGAISGFVAGATEYSVNTIVDHEEFDFKNFLFYAASNTLSSAVASGAFGGLTTGVGYHRASRALSISEVGVLNGVDETYCLQQASGESIESLSENVRIFELSEPLGDIVVDGRKIPIDKRKATDFITAIGKKHPELASIYRDQLIDELKDIRLKSEKTFFSLIQEQVQAKTGLSADDVSTILEEFKTQIFDRVDEYFNMTLSDVDLDDIELDDIFSGINDRIARLGLQNGQAIDFDCDFLKMKLKSTLSDCISYQNAPAEILDYVYYAYGVAKNNTSYGKILTCYKECSNLFNKKFENFTQKDFAKLISLCNETRNLNIPLDTTDKSLLAQVYGYFQDDYVRPLSEFYGKYFSSTADMTLFRGDQRYSILDGHRDLLLQSARNADEIISFIDEIKDIDIVKNYQKEVFKDGKWTSIPLIFEKDLDELLIDGAPVSLGDLCRLLTVFGDDVRINNNGASKELYDRLQSLIDAFICSGETNVTFINDRYTSTSVVESFARNWVGKGGEVGGLNEVITIPQGSKVIPIEAFVSHNGISGWGLEYEFMVNYGAKIRIDSLRYNFDTGLVDAHFSLMD